MIIKICLERQDFYLYNRRTYNILQSIFSETENLKFCLQKHNERQNMQSLKINFFLENKFENNKKKEN